MLDWDLIRSFLAVAENGTLAQAAEKLGVSQPTIGRHIDALEAELGLTLFSRGRHGMTPTEAGLSLIDDARDMRRGADHFALRAVGKAENVGGTVRITASEVVATFILPPIIAGFAQEEPDIEIELAPSNTVENLLSRDADIAIRMVRPDQNDVIARKVNDMSIGVYMHRELARRDGVPKSPDALLAHRVIGMDRSDLIIGSMTRLGFKAQRNDFTIRTDHQIAYVELVKSGAAIGFIAQFIAKTCPELIRILPEIRIPSLPLWLASHRELRTSRRIRRTMDYLYEALRALPLDE